MMLGPPQSMHGRHAVVIHDAADLRPQQQLVIFSGHSR